MNSLKKLSVLSMNGGRPGKKRKGKSKSTNGGQFAGPSVKQTIRYEPKAILSAPKKGATNVSNLSTSSSMLNTAETSPKQNNFTTSNSFSALNDDEEEDDEVENVYDESVNLFKTAGNSSFSTVVDDEDLDVMTDAEAQVNDYKSKIAEDVFFEIAGFVYLVDFVIL
nr:hypothetical protein [Tanacetum cinerariifolium]